ncbi:hypothetical protein GCM10025858_21780 [Alicyclobacillus sacchari]|nr:hypothetical protein GCM10025858_21780 [Alicyclobacillus sacchari]
MDNNVQKYFVRVSYESQDTYKIELGNAEKQINQIIVRNPSGMFIVSPALGKVFRFNGNWAQNQGQIYLYNQLLNQITAQKSVKVQKNGGVYSFDVPVTPRERCHQPRTDRFVEGFESADGETAR